jgi:hypothetical protein
VEIPVRSRSDSCSRAIHALPSPYHVEGGNRSGQAASRLPDRVGVETPRGFRDHRSALERLREGKQFARTRFQSADARQEPFDVGKSSQRPTQRPQRSMIREQRSDRIEAPFYHFGPARGMHEPFPELARARRGFRLIEMMDESRIGCVSPQRLEYLEVPERLSIEKKTVPRDEKLDPGDVHEIVLPQLFYERKKGTRGRDRERLVLEAETGEIAHAEMRPKRRAGELLLELIRRPIIDRRAIIKRLNAIAQAAGTVRNDRLAQPGSGERLLDQRRTVLPGAEFSRGNIEDRETGPVGAIDHGDYIVVLPIDKRRRRERGPGRDDVRDDALYDSRGAWSVLRLVADHDGPPQLEEFCDVGFGCMDWNSGEGYRIALVLVARRESYIEEPGNLLRIVVECLVKIPYLKEENPLGVPVLDLPVLAHEGREAIVHFLLQGNDHTGQPEPLLRSRNIPRGRFPALVDSHANAMHDASLELEAFDADAAEHSIKLIGNGKSVRFRSK